MTWPSLLVLRLAMDLMFGQDLDNEVPYELMQPGWEMLDTTGIDETEAYLDSVLANRETVK